MLKRVIVAVILIGITITLGTTGWGYVKFNSPAGSASIMQIPVLVSTFLGGFPEGIISALVYSITSWQRFPAMNAWVHFPARILIPILAGLVFLLIRRLLSGKPVLGDFIGALIGSAIGSLVNTWGVLGTALALKYMPSSQVLQVWVAHGQKELLYSVLVVTPVVVLFGILLRKLNIRQ